MIIRIIDHFSVFAKFREIPRKYQNSTEKGKFHGSAQNSVTRGKLGPTNKAIYSRTCNHVWYMANYQ